MKLNIKNKKNIIVILSIFIVIFLCIFVYITKFKTSYIVENNTINELVYGVNVKSNDVYDLEFQNQIEKEIDKVKKWNNYSIKNPFFVFNPYGTILNGLYIFFKTSSECKIEYTIKVEGAPDYTNCLVGDFTKVHEGTIVGLKQNKKNILTLKSINENNECVESIDFTLNIPEIDTSIIEDLNISEYGNLDEIIPGLFGILGINEELLEESNWVSNKLCFYDNNGIARIILSGDAGKKGKNFCVTEDNDIIFPYDGKALCRINKFGKIKDIYKNLSYSHEFTYKDGKIYSCRSTTEGVYVYDLSKKESKELFNFKNLLPDIYQESLEYSNEINNKNDTSIGDWIHCNSIAFVNDNDIVVSSRERSTIFYIKDIFKNPSIKYMIGPEEMWENTKYKNLLLKKDGDFIVQLGQHSIRVEIKDDGSYNLYMFNNNDVRSNLVPNKNWGEGYLENFEVKRVSKFYKYSINEENRTFSLVESFDFDYSASKSSVQKLNDNNIIASSLNGSFAEYGKQDDIIIKFYLNSEINKIFSCYKQSFNNIFFSDVNNYKNFDRDYIDSKVYDFKNVEILNGDDKDLFKFYSKNGEIYGLKRASVSESMYFNDTYIDIYNCNVDTLYIPNVIDGKNVYKLSNLNLSGVKKIVIPDGIKYVEEYCFAGSPDLLEVVVPKSVKLFPESALYKTNAVVVYD